MLLICLGALRNESGVLGQAADMDSNEAVYVHERRYEVGGFTLCNVNDQLQ
jgi:hypothetical protein